jgi:hypothetical protein
VLAVPSGSIVTDNDYSLPVYAAAAAATAATAAAAAAAAAAGTGASTICYPPIQIAAKIEQCTILLQPAPNAKRRTACVTPSHKCLAQLPPPCSSNSCRCFRFQSAFYFTTGFALALLFMRGVLMLPVVVLTRIFRRSLMK